MVATQTLDPLVAIKHESDCDVHSVVEFLILHSLHHGANRLEFRTIEGEFRVAQLFDEGVSEWPEPTEDLRQRIIDSLRAFFSMNEGQREREQVLRVGESTGPVACRITKDDSDAILEFTEPLQPAIDLQPVLAEYWRARAAKQGRLSLIRHHMQHMWWDIEDWFKSVLSQKR